MRRLLRTSWVFFTLSTSSVYASTTNSSEALLSRDDIKSQAVELCRIETERRYGSDTIRLIADKSSWSRDLQGALVKMKIKPAAKRAKKYYCVVKADKSVDYILR